MQYSFQQPQGVAQAVKIHRTKISIDKYFKLFPNIMFYN